MLVGYLIQAFGAVLLCGTIISAALKQVAVQKKEIADLKKQLAAVPMPMLGECGSVQLSKSEQLAELRKEQRALDSRVIELQVETEVEALLPQERGA